LIVGQFQEQVVKKGHSYTESLQRVRNARQSLELRRRAAIFFEYHKIGTEMYAPEEPMDGVCATEDIESLVDTLARQSQDQEEFAYCEAMDVMEANYMVRSIGLLPDLTAAV
jgi:hypothetical protein